MFAQRTRNRVIKYKTLLENFSFLSALQFSNLLLFLIIVPYLFRTLGDINYGLVVFAQTFVLYFNIFINFGFNITATRDISINRDRPEKLNEIVSSVLILKLLLFIVSFAVMLSFVNFIPEFETHRKLFLYSMLFCFSETLFPIWYFQGIERMKYITFINVTVRIAYTVLAVILIKVPEDYYLYPVIQGSGSVLGALTGLFILFGSHGIKFRFTRISTLWSYFSKNVSIFISNLSSQIYVNANRLIIGAVAGMGAVAYYDVAERMINIIKMPFFLLAQTIFPKVSRDRDLRFIKSIFRPGMLISVLAVVSVFIFSDPIIRILSGEANSESILILRILSISIIPVAASMFFAELLLLPFDHRIPYTRLRFFSLVFYLILIIILYIASVLTAYTIAITVTVTEIFVACYAYILCRKNGIVFTR